MYLLAGIRVAGHEPYGLSVGVESDVTVGIGHGFYALGSTLVTIADRSDLSVVGIVGVIVQGIKVDTASRCRSTIRCRSDFVPDIL